MTLPGAARDAKSPRKSKRLPWALSTDWLPLSPPRSPTLKSSNGVEGEHVSCQTAASRSPAAPPHRHPLPTQSWRTPRSPAFPGPGCVSQAIRGSHVPSWRSQREARDPLTHRGRRAGGAPRRHCTGRRSWGRSLLDGLREPPRPSSRHVSGTLSPAKGSRTQVRRKVHAKVGDILDSDLRRDWVTG